MIFLVFRVPGHMDHFHAVQQRRWDGLKTVGSGDEHHLGKIKGDLDVMVAELAILLRIQHLQQRRSGIAGEIEAQLVDLIQHKDRVVTFDPANGLKDATGHGTDVGAPMSADLSFVAHTAQRDAHELSVQSPGDGLTQGGLADARWSNEAQDHSFTDASGSGPCFALTGRICAPI